MSDVFSIDDLLSAPEPGPKPVEVPEWGDKVIVVKPLTKVEQQECRRRSQNKDGSVDSEKLERRLFQKGVVDPPLQWAHVEALFSKKDSGVIDRILGEILTVSDADSDAFERAEDDMKSG